MAQRTPAGLRSRRVAGEYEVTILRGLVAGVAGLVKRLVARLSVREVRKSPAAGRGIFLRVLDHELDILDRPGDEGFEAEAGEANGQDLVVFIRRGFIPVQRRDD